MVNKVAFGRFCSGFRTGWLRLLICMCVAGWAVSADAEESKLIVFNAPGADLTPGDYNGTFPAGINARGVITGSYIDLNNVYHGFLRNPNGKFTTFEAPGADITAGSYNGTSPSSINDLGEITGNYWDATGFSHGFVRSPDGKYTSFDVPGAAGYGSTPIAINLEGAIVGYYTDANYSFSSFLRRSDGTFATFIGPDTCTGNGSEGCYGSGASNINAFGTIAAGYNDINLLHHGLVRNLKGKLTTYDVPGAQDTGCPGCASGLNQFGAIAGTYSDANGVQHGFLRTPGRGFTTFDAPGAGSASYQGTGCPSDCPTSLNDAGAIMGSYIDANYVLHGYLRAPNGKIVTVDPVGSVFTWSSGMNDFEAITGYYADANGVYHGFLRIPD